MSLSIDYDSMPKKMGRNKLVPFFKKCVNVFNTTFKTKSNVSPRTL